MYRAAGLDPTPLRQSPMLIRLVERGYKKTAKEWKNFTGTLADKAQKTFIKQCDTAYHLVTSGGMSYSQAVVQAVEHTASVGVTIRYPSGHTDTVETATLRAVRTGAAQACGDITLARMKEMDWDIVLTSAHIGARLGDEKDNWTNHYWWQGRFFSRSGASDKFPRFDLCGWGYVDGIYGANCRHSFGPGDGEFNPYEHFDSEENRLRVQRDERMRLLERRIRASSREVMALQEAVDKAPDGAVKAGAEAAYRRKAKVLARQEKEYDDFCAENQTRKLYDRLQVAKYGARQARAAEKAAENTLAKSVEKSIMQNREGYARQEGNEPVIPERYKDDFTDFEPLQLEPEERTVLENLHKYAAESGFEYGQARTEKGFSTAFTSGERNEVGIPIEFRDAKQIDLYHSHTNVTPLSAQDFGLLTRENVNSVFVVTANGDVFSVKIGDGWRPTRKDFDAVVEWLRRDVDMNMVNWPDYDIWTPAELNYMSIREQAYRIATYFKWHLEGGKL